MSKVVDLDERRPHYAGLCSCLTCKHEWTGVAPTMATVLECPSCRTMSGVTFSAREVRFPMKGFVTDDGVTHMIPKNTPMTVPASDHTSVGPMFGLPQMPRAADHGALRADLAAVLNRHSRENGSNTPDFILAQYLSNCLDAYDVAIGQRAQWYGRVDSIGGPLVVPQPTPANE